MTHLDVKPNNCRHKGLLSNSRMCKRRWNECSTTSWPRREAKHTSCQSRQLWETQTLQLKYKDLKEQKAKFCPVHIFLSLCPSLDPHAEKLHQCIQDSQEHSKGWCPSEELPGSWASLWVFWIPWLQVSDFPIPFWPVPPNRDSNIKPWPRSN